MKSKSIVLLAFAGICGLVAMLGVRKALSSKEPAVETVPVLVATTELAAMTQLDETNSEFKAVPITDVPEGAITDRAQYEDRSVKFRSLPGDWLTESKLNPVGVKGASGLIPKGMRVVTVGVNQTTSHSGMLTPGNRVDVMLTYLARTEEGSTQRTRTVLQFIEIFAVDKLVDGGGNTNLNESNTRNVSVLVTPEHGHLLLLAEKKGDIHLALRSNLDTETATTTGISAEELEGNLSGAGDTQSRRDKLAEMHAEDGELAEADTPPLDDFLQDAAVGTTANTTAAAPAPAKNVWEMTIYSGGESTKHEVIEEVKEEPVSSAANTDTKDGKKSFWRGLMGAYFHGA
jgi:pilus assembly protein CpaB